MQNRKTKIRKIIRHFGSETRQDLKENEEKKIRKTITLSPKTAKKIEIKAKEENRSISNCIEHILNVHFRELAEME